ncbi:hypothetical protein K1T71_006253 [Dendrolimus kikuchii]|uniref:Uncharacterized protein n=1 Tax=Dendrolimus kikuchii TaxID=765133 RepID=A0ACC1D3T1_9NEOP|nr:hypothetical protein K1T71_006253 [Dendrolimus kikuchii]
MVNSYLQDRKILVNYARAVSERSTTKGCVQGSIGGPTFWNIILDPLLHKLTGMGVHCQAFADDVVLTFSDTTVQAMEIFINSALDTVTEWGSQNKLNFAAHKTNVMLLTKKLKLSLVSEMKILGLNIDRNLSFIPHVAAVCKKSANIYKQLACAAKVTWGLNGEIVRTIYVAVIEPIVMYAASAWYQATKLQTVRNRLGALQRCFAQKICKAYRTTSLTSVTVLSGTLPLDLKIRESALLYQAKKGKLTDFLPQEGKLETRVNHLDLPHPAELTKTEFELLENLDSETIESHNLAGPYIYTDGSKIEGKVGAALTWWDQDKETSNSTFSLHPFCTVFQSELYALLRAVNMAKDSSELEINIMSDSRSSLELLSNPKPYHPLAKSIQEGIKKINAEGRRVRLFWIRAHTGTAGNERADELAKQAALERKDAPDYDELPISYVKKKIREESVRLWQDRYDSSSTGSVTKTFFPNVATAYRVVRKEKLTHLQVQILTGHGAMAEYLHRFKLKSSPECECDPNVNESVWHIVLECPRFSAKRMDCESQIGEPLTKDSLHTILANTEARPHLLAFFDHLMAIVFNRNSTLHKQVITETTHTQEDPPQSQSSTPPPPPALRRLNLQYHGEEGTPGIRLRGVTLFMDSNKEKIGIAFCEAHGRKNVTISPGLASLIKGSTTRNIMRRRDYDSLAQAQIAGIDCRIARERGKEILLFDKGNNISQFLKARQVLTELWGASTGSLHTPRRISLDTMVVGYERGQVSDYWGAVLASEYHEIVVYENRGGNLSFLKPYQPGSDVLNPIDHRGRQLPQEDGLSGSERLQKELEAGWQEAKQKPLKPISNITALVFTELATRSALNEPTTSAISISTLKNITVGDPLLSKSITKQQTLTPPVREPPKARLKADMGIVEPPILLTPMKPSDHWANAFIEFLAVCRANIILNKKFPPKTPYILFISICSFI